MVSSPGPPAAASTWVDSSSKNNVLCRALKFLVCYSTWKTLRCIKHSDRIGFSRHYIHMAYIWVITRPSCKFSLSVLQQRNRVIYHIESNTFSHIPNAMLLYDACVFISTMCRWLTCVWEKHGAESRRVVQCVYPRSPDRTSGSISVCLWMCMCLKPDSPKLVPATKFTSELSGLPS